MGLFVGVLATLGLLLHPAAAEEFWKEKPSSEWTQDEVLALLTDSPWAKQVTILHPTGRLVEFVSEEERSYVTGQGKPRFRSTVKKGQTRPELVEADYTVRWNSAPMVQRAWERLPHVAPQAIVDLYAPPPELSARYSALTVQVTRPPSAPAIHLFHGLSDGELLQAATLRTDQEEQVKPVAVFRHGVGAGEGVLFLFPRSANRMANEAAAAKWFEFVFLGRGGEKLKAKFDLLVPPLRP
jgi:hypothetical protein